MGLDYLVIGALTRDIVGRSDWKPGGSSWYASHAVKRWGGSVAIISPVMSNLIVELPATIPLLRLPSQATATFDNSYQGDERTQFINAVPTALDWAAISPAWRDAAIVHLAPLAGEVASLPARRLFGRAFMGVTAQGWLRHWDKSGRISPAPWHPQPTELATIDAIVVSEEDVGGDETQPEEWAAAGPIVAITRGARGVTIWHNAHRIDLPAVATTVIDPTGAGDTWAAAFFWKLRHGEDVEAAGAWACAEASWQIGTPATPPPAAS